MYDRLAGGSEPGQPGANPRLKIVRFGGHQPTLGAGTAKLGEGHGGHKQIGDLGERVPVAGVTENEPFVLVPQDDALGYALDGIVQLLLSCADWLSRLA